MALKSPQRTQSADTNTNDRWKAAGFLNMYLPSADGGRTKLHAIPLKANDRNHAKLLDLIGKDEEKALKAIMNNLEVEYRSAEPSEGRDFALNID